MKAFLCSDFSPVAMSKIDPYIGDLKGKHVLFIVTAAHGEGFEPDEAETVAPFISRGATIERYDVAGKSRDEVSNKIKVADIISVSGGDTFHLLEHLNACGFKELLSSEWAQQKIYIGSSAGSIVTGPDIEFIRPMDINTRSTITDCRGFGWIDFLFLPHWKTQTMLTMATAAERVVTEYKGSLPLIAFCDEQVVYLPDVQQKLMMVL